LKQKSRKEYKLDISHFEDSIDNFKSIIKPKEQV